ncbi:hypothetical protein B0H14DRAFT_122397 [Mycena olivaceomarginata]|nr:hypothetical protein B0H14DRAFT_122397 [Mycena olivaceomarginata]
MNRIPHHEEPGLYILRRAAASDAFHDSAERYPQPRCHAETRVEILKDLWNWTSETDPSSTVLWLHGPAGAGKSAIAQSFCQNLAEKRSARGQFFLQKGASISWKCYKVVFHHRISAC